MPNALRLPDGTPKRRFADGVKARIRAADALLSLVSVAPTYASELEACVLPLQQALPYLHGNPSRDAIAYKARECLARIRAMLRDLPEPDEPSAAPLVDLPSLDALDTLPAPAAFTPAPIGTWEIVGPPKPRPPIDENAKVGPPITTEYGWLKMYHRTQGTYKEWREMVRRAQRAYSQSAQGKMTRHKYERSEKGKAAAQRYAQSEAGRAAQARAKQAYAKSDKGKAAYERYAQSEAGKAARARATRAYRERQQQKLIELYQALDNLTTSD